MDRTPSVCSPLLDKVHHSRLVIIGGSRYGTAPFTSPLVPDCLYGIRAVYASGYRGIPLDIICFILLLKHLIMQIVCQGSINYLLFITSKY